MNQVTPKQWVEALRSGEYKQTRWTLADNEGYCCIGVLACLTEGKEAVDDVAHRRSLETEPLYQAALKQPAIIDPALAADYMSMNDSQRLSFSEIADFIEEKAREKGLWDE